MFGYVRDLHDGKYPKRFISRFRKCFKWGNGKKGEISTALFNKEEKCETIK